MNYVKLTLDKINQRCNMTWIWDSFFRGKKVESLEDFAAQIYTISVEFPNTVWLDLKPFFVGSEHVIQIVCPKTQPNVINGLLPVQFDNHSTKSRFRHSWCDFAQYVIDGKTGERAVLDTFNYIASTNGGYRLKTSGKACFLEQPLLSSTPDYILTMGNDDDDTVRDLFNKNRDYKIYGIGECKTRVLSKPIIPTNINSAKAWIETTKSVDQQKSLLKKCSVWDKAEPDWLHLEDFKELKTSIKATRWWYVSHDHQILCLDPNGVTIDLIGDKIGRQMLAEAMSIEPFVKEADDVTCRLYLPNFIRNDMSNLKMHSCIYCEFILKKKTLRSIRKTVVARFNLLLDTIKIME